ncbi:MAG: ASKHA domain-containing protein [Solirubrobacteraceae bacterium]
MTRPAHQRKVDELLAAGVAREARREVVQWTRAPREAELSAPEDGSQRVRLRFIPDGAEVRVPSGTPVFDAASWNGIAIDSTCGGYGTCKKCKVRIVSGDVPVGSVDPRAFTADELRDGWRLACRANARGDLVVEVPPLQTRPKAALVGVGRHVILRPSVQKRHLVLTEASMEDQRSDLQRVLDGLEDLEPHASLELLRTLGGTLRQANFDVTAVVCDEELIDVEPGDTSARRFAIAFDIGTTTVVANLLDLESGQPVAVRSMLNRQQPYGADVITRISATMMDDGALEELRKRAQETLAELTAEVCAEGGVEPREVYEITACGNATMIHLVLGVDPEPLSMAPFVVSTHKMPPVMASDLGVEIHPRAPAFVFPSLGAYVGGDIVAGLLATGITRDRRLRLFIDVGTNSEIALGSNERVLATAAPAGPAFEAAQIKCGMRAADGAIEGVKIDGESVALQVIGDVDPVGMCGSGLVDAVAELVQRGLLDHSGRFVSDEVAAEDHPALSSRLTKIGQERVFVLHWRGEDPETSVFLSQRDVRELQFAKASIATGWQILMSDLGVSPDDVAQVLLAGSFGAYLTPLSAVRIGLVPKLALPRIVSAGNVAGEGAKIAALSSRERAEAHSILREVEYVELSGRADFNDMFIDQLAFPG